MDTHAEYLPIAGLLRASARATLHYRSGVSSVTAELTGTADTVDPHGYSPAIEGVADPVQDLEAAVPRLDAIPGDIRPMSADPMRAHWSG